MLVVGVGCGVGAFALALALLAVLCRRRRNKQAVEVAHLPAPRGYGFSHSIHINEPAGSQKGLVAPTSPGTSFKAPAGTSMTSSYDFAQSPTPVRSFEGVSADENERASKVECLARTASEGSGEA
eukprot:487568-Rhodomonas_salina.2